MPKTCILTDSSAQFPTHTFKGERSVCIVPFDLQINDQLFPECGQVKSTDLPASTLGGDLILAHPPSAERYASFFQAYTREFDQFLVITQTELMSASFANAVQAAENEKGKTPILVINSQTTSVGLGTLVQLAAEMADHGKSLAEIEHFIRRKIPHIYSLICTPGLSYLEKSHLIDPAQALVGEMLNFFTVYSLEAEQLIPMEKIRNARAVPDLFLEFLEEFDKLNHISLIQNQGLTTTETRSIKQNLQELYPQAAYTEHALNIPFAAQFSPQAIAMVAVEKI
jgi:DegV family protein with EDD domain